MMKEPKITYISSIVERNLDWASRRKDPDFEHVKAQLELIADKLTGKSDPSNILEVLLKSNNTVHSCFRSFFNGRIASYWKDWRSSDPFFKAFVKRENLQTSFEYVIKNIIHYKLLFSEAEEAESFIKLCLDNGFQHEEILQICLTEHADSFQYYDYENRVDGQPAELVESSFSLYLLSLLKNPKFRDSKGEFIYNELITDCSRKDGSKLLKFLLMHGIDFPLPYLRRLLFRIDYHTRKSLNNVAIAELLKRSGAQHESMILDLMEEYPFSPVSKLVAYKLLNDQTPNKFQKELLGLSKELMGGDNGPAWQTYSASTPDGPACVLIADFLHSFNAEACKEILLKFVKEKTQIHHKFFEWIDEQYQEAGVKYYINALKHPLDQLGRHQRGRLYELLKKNNLTQHKETLLDLAQNYSNRESRILLTKIIADKVEGIIPDASALLKGRTIDHRITGALILSHIKDDAVQALLLETLDKEKNDDTRDVMLETLAETKYEKGMSLNEVKEMISLAVDRKKLKDFKEKWLEEEKLPPLFWKENGEELDQYAKRFIFYRMKRAKGINSDLEARKLFDALDKEKSGPFAKALIQAFVDSNADTKLKHLLSISAFLGDDDVLRSLDSLFRKSIKDKRTKMAEYIVGALAMVGSDKALRTVEVISRKFANKKKTVATAALNALSSAAEELNITTDELADRIIPDFGFEGLYKRFDVEGEEYRAFINAEFKINYFNEDNKMRKSVPKGTDPALKKEFREIEKEIRAIVKSQSGRLEKYMVEGRLWPASDWQEFFFQNPIMFVYAMKLLWVVRNAQDELIDCFYIDEDASLYNLEDEEVEIEDGQFVSILHPFYLPEELREKWRDKVYELSMDFIFPILDRPIFKKKEEELDKAFTNRMNDQKVSKGPDFAKAFLVKKGWAKETGDGGHIDFVKRDLKNHVRAYVYIEGVYVYYQQNEGEPPIGAIDFRNLKTNKQINIRDVSDLFYSEVIADIDALVKAE